ncbi:AaceriACL106Cp [[Ashbya] aceris (nom. inval.)]|nr:AaceriACL106Cp [[Ashbya] aceris (nom. inval.)]
MTHMSDCAATIWPAVSVASGVIAFTTSFVASIPQVIETYREKSVDGLSPLCLLCWVSGDITTLVGSVLTHQLPFQVVQACYYFLADFILCCQYYYYGMRWDNRLATRGPVLAAAPSPAKGMLVSCLLVGQAAAAPLLRRDDSVAAPPLPVPSRDPIGITSAWLGASLYFFSRIPQLLKNYRRKSTDGLSPLLFIAALTANLTYCVSVFTSCEFLANPDKSAFVWNALPFILGSGGTVVFDLIYFYQHYYLYREKVQYKRLEYPLETEVSPLVSR